MKIPQTSHPRRRRHRLSPVPCTLFLTGLISATAGAAVTITGSAVFNSAAGDYTYNYSVINTGPEDVAIVTIPAFSPLGVTNSFAPAGFVLTFDSSQWVVNFTEDGSILTPQTFGPGSTTGTFSFNSATAPGNVNFLAYDAAGTEFTGSVVAPVPESSAAALTGLASALMLRRRRAHTTRS